MKRFTALFSLVLLTGCASITSESTQLIRVDALDESGNKVEETTCVLRNDKGEYNADAGKHTQIAKSILRVRNERGRSHRHCYF